MTLKFALNDFASLPPGSEAVPPEDSEYHRAIRLPDPEHDSEPWVLLRGEGPTTVADRVGDSYLVVSGFAPAEQIGMTLGTESPEPGEDRVRVRVSIDFPRHTGAYAWAVASRFPELLSDEEVLSELFCRGDHSVEALLGDDLIRRILGEDDLDADDLDADDLARAIERHPAGKGRDSEEDEDR